jgi:hypothetical protein
MIIIWLGLITWLAIGVYAAANEKAQEMAQKADQNFQALKNETEELLNMISEFEKLQELDE